MASPIKTKPLSGTGLNLSELGLGSSHGRQAPADVIDKAKRIEQVCSSHNIALPAAALLMPISHPLVATVIPGPRSRVEVQDILNWWNLDIPTSLWSDLKTEGLMHPETPTP